MLLKKSRKGRLEDTLEHAVDRARDQATDLIERMAPHLEHARDRLADDYLPAASGTVAGAVAGAREAVPVVQDAASEAARRTAKNYRSVVRPAAQDAYEYTRDVRVPAAREAWHEARDKAVPAAQAALLAAQERAREKAAEVQAGLPGQKKKSSKGKKLLIALGVVGLGAGVAKLVQGRQRDRTLPYVPPTPATRTTSAEAAAHPGAASTAGSASAAAASAAAEQEALGSRPDILDGGVPAGPQVSGGTDAGGSGPGEALSDEHDGPHPVTTPDTPADSETVERPDA
jgi:hypothetical protein